MSGRTLALVLILVLSSLPTVAAENASQTLDPAEPDVMHQHAVISTYTDIPISGTSVQEFVCGYSVDRVDRGDDCDGKTVTQAPGERWFRLSVQPGMMGNEMRLKVENLDDPHKVDLEIDFCRTNSITQADIQCFDRDDMYGEVNQYLDFNPIFSNEYWIHVLAFDEEKEGRNPGGDLTKVRVTLTRNIDSNADRQEPELMSAGAKLERKVCERTCETASEVDPVDVFKIEGYAGDEIEVSFGSRENDVVGHYDLLVYYNHETDFYDTSKSTKVYGIDDSCHYDNDPASYNCVSTLSYTFDTSGYVLIYFIALGEDEDFYENKAESYTIYYESHDSSGRSQTADRDGDGLPDDEERRCGSDFRDPDSTARDFDGDKLCDDNDDDDDNDGIADLFDPCPFSTSQIDHDNDGCDDADDSDDDNDGVIDGDDLCPTGELGPHNAADDVDLDGCVNSEDDDDDNDGWYDDEETQCLTDSLDQNDVPLDWDIEYEHYVYETTGQYIYECDVVDADDDQDSVPDTLDTCQFSVWYQITPQLTLVAIDEDLDGDGCFNAEDSDDDADSILDNADACPQGMLTGPDFDGDGCKDAEDDDIDNDGYENDYEEACGTSPRDASSLPTGSEYDTDSDGECDNVDDDDDNDGVADSADRFPFDPSENQDTDNDGIGNNQDTDDDGDSVLDSQDDFPLDSNEQIDTDGDGIGNNADTDDDNDSWSDVLEGNCQTLPLDKTSVPSDLDGDGICDPLDDDIDGDTYSNNIEENCNSDPQDGSSVPENWDNDAKCDALDDDDDNDGKTDFDGNGYLLDACQFTPAQYVGTKDTDNDGCFDAEPMEVDKDGDGITDEMDKCPLIFADTENGCEKQSFFEANQNLIGGGAVVVILGLLFAAGFVFVQGRARDQTELQSQRILAEAGVSKTNVNIDQSVRTDNSKKMMLSQMNQHTMNRNKNFSNVLNAEKNSNVVSHGTNFNDTGDESNEL